MTILYVGEQKCYQELEYRDFGVHISGVVRFNEQNLAQVNSANKTSVQSKNFDQSLEPFILLLCVLINHLNYASKRWSPKSVTMIRHSRHALLGN